MTPETKMIERPSGDTRAALDALLRAFEAFKETNDRRISELEARAGDPLTETKLARIDQALDEQKSRLDRLALEGARPPLSAEPGPAREAFSRYMRSGDASALREAKSLSRQSGPAGGYLAPSETEAVVERLMSETSPMRSAATVQRTEHGVYRKPVSLGGAGGGWTGETDPRGETTAPTLELVEAPSAELYAMPAATTALLDDAFVDVEHWLAEEIRDVFTAAENDAFINGDGSGKPKGVLAYTPAPVASQGWGELGYVPSGVAGGFNTTDPQAQFLDLVHARSAEVRARGRFMMSRAVLSAVRRLKDPDTGYLWSPGLQPGDDSRLLGHPIIENEAMPGVEAGEIGVLFGDFARAYLIVDHQGLEVLRDPYSAKPYVLFYTTKRVGGVMQNFDAITGLRLAEA